MADFSSLLAPQDPQTTQPQGDAPGPDHSQRHTEGLSEFEGRLTAAF